MCACSQGRSPRQDRKSTRLNSSHTEIYTLSLHDALPIFSQEPRLEFDLADEGIDLTKAQRVDVRLFARSIPSSRSEEHTSELQSHRDLHSFPTRRSSDLQSGAAARIRFG